MTHSFQCNRKQKRDDGEDFENYIPSAKRAKLKNSREHQNPETALGQPFFHIPNTPSQFASPNKDVSEDRSNMTNVSYQRGIAQYNVAPTELSYVTEGHMQQFHLKYLPDLNANENPHYYENNRLLFELYVQRIQRSVCHPPSTSHT